MTTDGAYFSGSGRVREPMELPAACAFVIASIKWLSDEALRELHGGAVQEHIRRENERAKAARRPV